MQLDPPIRLQAAATEHAFRGGHHRRQPDIAMDIRVFIPSCGNPQHTGHYIGHGQSKTVFQLQSAATGHANDSFHGAVLKLAKTEDMEPQVFQETCEASLTRFGQAVCSRIFYNCMGSEGERHQYHCWITETTIPLDEFARDQRVVKKQCTLAAFRCMLQAAACGLHLSDCHLFNFGVQITGDATEHNVVIIDAGSRGIQPPWSKAEINSKCMKKFWQWSRQEGAVNTEVEAQWRAMHDCQSCLAWADRQWRAMPRLTRTRIDTQTIQQDISARDQHASEEIKETGGYQIMKMVGGYACDGQWSESLSRACYRAARYLHVALEQSEAQILDELHSRIIDNRSEAQIEAVMATWVELARYAQDWPPTGYLGGDMTLEQTKEVLSSWTHYVLWHEQTEPQKRMTQKWHSRKDAMLYKRVVWIPVARAVIRYGMPSLQVFGCCDDATERINAAGNFARDLARWLQCFARALDVYRNTETYKKARTASRTPIETWGITGAPETSRRGLLTDGREVATHLWGAEAMPESDVSADGATEHVSEPSTATEHALLYHGSSDLLLQSRGG